MRKTAVAGKGWSSSFNSSNFFLDRMCQKVVSTRDEKGMYLSCSFDMMAYRVVGDGWGKRCVDQAGKREAPVVCMCFDQLTMACCSRRRLHHTRTAPDTECVFAVICGATLVDDDDDDDASQASQSRELPNLSHFLC